MVFIDMIKRLHGLGGEAFVAHLDIKTNNRQCPGIVPLCDEEQDVAALTPSRLNVNGLQQVIDLTAS